MMLHRSLSLGLLLLAASLGSCKFLKTDRYGTRRDRQRLIEQQEARDAGASRSRGAAASQPDADRPWMKPRMQPDEAYAVLRQRLDELTRQPPSTEKLDTLWRWPRGNPSLSDLTEEKELELVDEAELLRKETLEFFLDQYRTALANFGSGVDAIRAGEKWVQELDNDLARMRDRPEARALKQHFKEARELAFQEAHPTLVAELDQANEFELDGVISDWFRVPGDQFSKAYAAAQQSRDKRLAAIRVERKARAKQAMKAGASDPSQPLAYLDFEGYPCRVLLEHIYDASPLPEGWNPGYAGQDLSELAGLASEDDYRDTLNDMFTTYHKRYSTAFGGTAALREERGYGAEWVKQTVTQTRRNSHGSVQGESEREIVIRRPFLATYSGAYPDGAEGAARALRGLLSPKRPRPGQSADIGQNMLDMMGGVVSAIQSIDRFFETYSADYPATLRHFELNLHRAMLGEPLKAVSEYDPMIGR